MTAPLRIAIAGLGTVGVGVLRLLSKNGTLIAARSGRALQVVAVSARDSSKYRGVPLADYAWFDDATQMAREADYDVFVELIGGSDGIAFDAVAAALDAGRDVVTANKALLAVHGEALATKADQAGVTIAYEASIAGAIPVVKALREGLAGNRVTRLMGILNGTCNYILTEMEATGRDFAEVLADAQALGYAEVDPTFDVDGIDAAHKLALLAATAFGTPPAFDAVACEGIRNVSVQDMKSADSLGYCIKLLGIASVGEDGLAQRVQPCLIPKSSALATVSGSTNAVVLDGDFSDEIVLEGKGAGAEPTASAVVADIIDLARGIRPSMFGVPAASLVALPDAPTADHVMAFYVRLLVLDQPGVFADIAAALRDHAVSMESVLQQSRAPNEPVAVVMTIHEANESDVRAAFDAIGAMPSVVEPPVILRIEPC